MQIFFLVYQAVLEVYNNWDVQKKSNSGQNLLGPVAQELPEGPAHEKQTLVEAEPTGLIGEPVNMTKRRTKNQPEAQDQ